MVDLAQNDATPTDRGSETTLQDAARLYLGAQNSGVYASNATHILERWIGWAEDRGVTNIDEVSKRLLTNYATRLRRRTESNAIAASTAQNYFDVVAGLLTYAARRDWLQSNPARTEAAENELPAVDDGGRTTQQFWSPATREEIVRWADWRAEDALDHDWMDGEAAVRDRALVAIFAYSGVRGSEVVRDPRDDRRDGLNWDNVDFDGAKLEVYGKGMKTQHAPFPERARRFVRAHKRRQNPPDESWPVFRTRHLPTLYGGLPDDVEGVTPANVLDLYREHEITPPTLSTSGARSIIEGLCEESGIREDGEKLRPHGARRGLGDTLYRRNPELAQQALRHQSIDVTNESYRHAQTGEVSEGIDDVLE